MKKIGIVLLVIAMTFFTFACGSQSSTDTTDPKGTGGVVDPAPQEEKVEVILYYVNQEYVVTGNEDLDKIVAVEKEVTVGEKPLEEVILAELQKKPEDEKLTTFLENIKVLSVETAEKTAYVNLSSEKLSGGSLEEMMILNQVVLSLTELPGVEQVQFLVDGSKRETLMGHIIIEEPLKKGEVGK